MERTVEDFLNNAVVVTQQMVDDMPEIEYDLSDFLIIDKDYCSDPIWCGHSGANDSLDAYKHLLPNYLYDELNAYSRVWEVMAALSLDYIQDDDEDKVEKILSQMWNIDFTAWAKSLAERCAEVVPTITWGWREWNEGTRQYTTHVIFNFPVDKGISD